MPGNLGRRMVQNFTRRGYVVDVISSLSVAPRRANSTAFPVSSTIFFSSRTANSREGQVCTWFCPEGRLAVGVLSWILPPTAGGDAMDDAALIENEDLWSAHRAREVRGGPHRPGAATALEPRREASDIGAERGARIVGLSGLPAARN
jgi:hypothetical protein